MEAIFISEIYKNYPGEGPHFTHMSLEEVQSPTLNSINVVPTSRLDTYIHWDSTAEGILDGACQKYGTDCRNRVYLE
jgi:hypothetical protein